MITCIVRAWLPDRPGALGQVASRIGSVYGEIVGIDILERGAGRVIDELVVTLPSADVLDLLVTEVGHVDGVDVEEVRVMDDLVIAHAPEALEAVADVVEAAADGDTLGPLVHHVRRLLRADWCVVVDTDTVSLRAVSGEPPEPAWVVAYLASGSSTGSGGADDVAVAPIGDAGRHLVAGREGVGFRSAELRQFLALARIAAGIGCSVGSTAR